MSEESKPDQEIEILNADALDVEELEHRLEMAGTLTDIAMYCAIDICGADGCGVDGCTNFCAGLCTALCGLDGCATDCGMNTIGGCEDPTQIQCETTPMN